jgi:hypothetical protein
MQHFKRPKVRQGIDKYPVSPFNFSGRKTHVVSQKQVNKGGKRGEEAGIPLIEGSQHKSMRPLIDLNTLDPFRPTRKKKI